MALEPRLPTAETLDAAGCVAVDAPCVGCGYNVRTLHSSGLCPECGHSINHSLRGYFLPYAPARWVRGLAHGLLLLLIAGGTAFVGALLAGAAVVVAGVVPVTGMPFWSEYSGLAFAIRFLVGIVALALAIWGLTKLTQPDPAEAARQEGWTARRLLRLWRFALPLPTVIKLATAIGIQWWWAPMMRESVPGGNLAVPPALTMVMALSVVSTLSGAVVYVVLLLALLRHLGAIMRRVPRPGLVRLARVVYWGTLCSISLLAVAYGILFIQVLGMVNVFAASAAAANPSRGVTTTTQPTSIALAYTGTTYAPATMPATAPAGFGAAPFVRPTIGFMATMVVSGIGASAGGCGTVGFGIAALVLCVLAYLSLAAAARQAAQNAARTAGSARPAPSAAAVSCAEPRAPDPPHAAAPPTTREPL